MICFFAFCHCCKKQQKDLVRTNSRVGLTKCLVNVIFAAFSVTTIVFIYCYLNFFWYIVTIYTIWFDFMEILIVIGVIGLIVIGILVYRWMDSPRVLTAPKNFYDLQISLLNGHPLHFSDFAWKKVLIVNTASECGLVSQLWSLQNLYELYQDRLVVLGVPSNQFLWQEPKNGTEIAAFCQKNYGVTFLMTEKIFVKWRSQHPVYQRLTHKKLNDFSNSTVKWNYQKYLIDEHGKLIAIFQPTTQPFDKELIALLGANNW